jgi:ribonucleoside-triphosphate reductase (thioredoxin)
MDKDKEILSEITVFQKYAKYIPSLQRRESWEELIQRNMEMHLQNYPDLTPEIEQAYYLVKEKKVLPSMRSLQFAGKPIEVNPTRIFNCAYLPIEKWKAFSEVMFLLLGGTGVGYSVQYHHVDKLPEIRKPREDRRRRFVIGDSIEGWAEAVKRLMKSYFFGGPTVDFYFGDIRPKGAMLITSGGKAPGPEPLRLCLMKIESILRQKKDGDKLTPIEVHDINCHIADAVLAGGIRRAAMISLFSLDDDEMINCKSGAWWELNPQRGRANNSAVIIRSRVRESDFQELWTRIKASGSGEPGLYFTNDKDWGTNPCCEIALRPYQFCNLVEINASNLESEDDFLARCHAASVLATLQASYTDFHYLGSEWKRATEKDALLGVSMTGIASMEVFKYDIEKGVEVIKGTNKAVADVLGINPAARTTCVKPAGTTSLVLGTSSGIHAWHNDYYIRRMRIGKNESLYTYLSIHAPEMLEDCKFSPSTTAIISVPQKAPEGAVTRHESAIDLLERVKVISEKWIEPGHVSGMNTHNVSATISIRENEWEEVGDWMWNHREVYNGLSVLPYNGGTYVQAPFEDCTKEEYDALVGKLGKIDLSQVVEMFDFTDQKGEVACGGGACEVI